MRGVILAWVLLNLAAVAILGFRGRTNTNTPLYAFPDMDWQPRYDDQEASAFFADGRAMRKPPAGTVIFDGHDYDSDAGRPELNKEFLRGDAAYFDGKAADGSFVPTSPAWAGLQSESDRLALLGRGRERYTINCAVCHGATGDGKGITSQYGMIGVASYHDDRLRNMPDGEIFQTITNGKGIMMPYGHQVKVSDRWAIIAYVRALQLARQPDGPPAAAASTPAPAEASKAEEPKAEPPKAEPPKAEAPKAEAPKDELPPPFEELKADAPKAEEPPKVEQPKAEEPKAEEPKPEASKS